MEFDFAFECLNCKSEFRTYHDEEIEDKDKLTIQDMKEILHVLGMHEDKIQSAR